MVLNGSAVGAIQWQGTSKQKVSLRLPDEVIAALAKQCPLERLLQVHGQCLEARRLLASGAKTILISRWQTGGKTHRDLLRALRTSSTFAPRAN